MYTTYSVECETLWKKSPSGHVQHHSTMALHLALFYSQGWRQPLRRRRFFSFPLRTPPFLTDLYVVRLLLLHYSMCFGQKQKSVQAVSKFVQKNVGAEFCPEKICLDELIDHLDIHGEKKEKLWYTVFSKRISNLLVMNQGFKYELLLGFRHLLHNRDYFPHNQAL